VALATPLGASATVDARLNHPSPHRSTPNRHEIPRDGFAVDRDIADAFGFAARIVDLDGDSSAAAHAPAFAGLAITRKKILPQNPRILKNTSKTFTCRPYI